ncbi:tetratricopeptide repeat protein [Clostridium intestinale]|uniref:Uncharacterized protein n=1 Tax=Clostridium intestinale URNW TaxID=1294142 RepID=U2NNX8_9CLOT|nr:hypothetical protein [Clostridium intestinale]ERK30883.1 hypothetical protein CINTURNW_1708 [Clostridium intestinale URNW]
MKISQLKNKPFIILGIILILIMLSTPLGVYAYNTHNYNKFTTLGDNSLASDEFDQAIDNYSSALKYNKKNESTINDKIELTKQLKESKQNYTEALALFDENKFLEAADSFKKIPEADSKYYNTAKDKIDECMNQYIKENFNKAKSDAAINKYDSAISLLENILKIEATNTEALSLKEIYTKEIQNTKQLKEGTVNSSSQLASNVSQNANKPSNVSNNKNSSPSTNNIKNNSSNINATATNNSPVPNVQSPSNNTSPSNTQKNTYPIIVKNPGPHPGTMYTGSKFPPDIDIPYKSLFHEDNLGYMTVTVGRYPTWSNEVFESWDLEIFLFDNQLFFKRKDHNMSPIYPSNYYVTVKNRETSEILFKYIPE